MSHSSKYFILVVLSTIIFINFDISANNNTENLTKTNLSSQQDDLEILSLDHILQPFPGDEAAANESKYMDIESDQNIVLQTEDEIIIDPIEEHDFINTENNTDNIAQESNNDTQVLAEESSITITNATTENHNDIENTVADAAVTDTQDNNDNTIEQTVSNTESSAANDSDQSFSEEIKAKISQQKRDTRQIMKNFSTEQNEKTAEENTSTQEAKNTEASPTQIVESEEPKIMVPKNVVSTKATDNKTEKETTETKILSNDDIDQAESNKVKINTTKTVLGTNAIPAENLNISKNTISSIMQNTAIIDQADELKIIPVARPIDNPFLVRASEFFYNTTYDYGNSHIAEPTYQEEYYQLLFATILTENLSGIRAVTAKIGPNYDIFVDNLSPLTYAINNNNNPDIIRQMLSLGYSPNITDLNSKSPLHYAVELRKYDFAIELLLWGADPKLANNNNISPYDLAMHADDTIMLDILNRIAVN